MLDADVAVRLTMAEAVSEFNLSCNFCVAEHAEYIGEYRFGNPKLACGRCAKRLYGPAMHLVSIFPLLLHWVDCLGVVDERPLPWG